MSFFSCFIVFCNIQLTNWRCLFSKWTTFEPCYFIGQFSPASAARGSLSLTGQTLDKRLEQSFHRLCFMICIWQGVYQLDLAFARDHSQGELEGLLPWTSQGGGKVLRLGPPHSRHSSTFRGSTSSIASSARDRDLTRRRLTSSSCPLFLSSTFQGSIRKGFTPGGTLLLFPTETITSIVTGVVQEGHLSG